MGLELQEGAAAESPEGYGPKPPTLSPNMEGDAKDSAQKQMVTLNSELKECATQRREETSE